MRHWKVFGIAMSAALVLALASVPGHALTTVSSCGTLDRAGETYRLEANLSSGGTCLTLQASDITLDGNGHSITWSTSGPGFGLDVKERRAEIFGLTMIKGGYAVDNINSHAMTVARAEGLKIHHNTFQLVNNGSSAFYGIFVRGGGNDLDIHDNTFNSTGSACIVNIKIDANVTGNIHRNTSTIGGTLRIAGTRTAHVVVAPSQTDAGRLGIHHNTFTTGQGTVEVQGVQLYEGDNVDVHHNTFLDYGGHARAILFDKSHNGTAYENTITMAGSDDGGISIGIRARYGTRNLQIYNNTVIANDCDGGCTAIFLGAEGSQPYDISVHHNIFAGKDRVVYFSQNIRDTVFHTNQVTVGGEGKGLYFLEWDGVMENLAFSNTRIVTNGSAAHAVHFEDTGSQGPTQGVRGVTLCGVTVNGSALAQGHMTDGGGDNHYQVLGTGCVGGSGFIGAGGDGGNDGDDDGSTSGSLGAPSGLRRTDIKP